YTADEIKDEPEEFKDEPLDEFDGIEQEEPALNALYLGTTDEIKEELMEIKDKSIDDIKLEEPSVDDELVDDFSFFKKAAQIADVQSINCN
ncbi:hypothetical protein PMAYCL1PPCAC_04994, partial [Pristionchus mayeri]